ncbi:4-hydroxythreonine-4-phosphate dehydrogenase PdxA [Methylophaga sp. OBS3]|uniref:4-hydroxythreonine-4-phosphate dehydrogenase PdxA n=1 Tax=Methylophaga sp. OBS3 TaxID=2991934 RepID=UPI003A4D3A0A
MTIKRLAITAGEPAGIGPDLVLMLAANNFEHELVVIADPLLLSERAKQLGITVELIPVNLKEPAVASQSGVIRYLPVSLDSTVTAGKLNSANASYVLETLRIAAEGCMIGQFDGVVTAPVHKGVINDAGISFSGHTEFFAEQAGVDKVVMMLATPELRVALATTHLPLNKVSEAITQPELTQIINIIQHSLQQQFDLAQPKIAVCGLNPHAGEGGHLGREEIDVIEPVIQSAMKAGIAASGPWPADTIFVKSRLDDYDVVLAMYHDQGLPVLKHQGFGEAVNITLGLPFIRTSVDHGTALDLAGTGKAEVGSLVAAVNMALLMSSH